MFKRNWLQQIFYLLIQLQIGQYMSVWNGKTDIFTENIN